MDTVSPDMKLQVMKATAVRQAMIELLSEQRAEVLRRAVAKLAAMGIIVKETDLEPQIS